MRLLTGLFALALFLLTPAVQAEDPLMVDLLKKGAKSDKETLKKLVKKYKIKEVEGTRIIGISREYYIINGKQVDCDNEEMRCVDGKCQMVAKH